MAETTPTPTQYTVPKWNSATGEGSLTYMSNKFGMPIADILAANQGNTGIYYQGTDPRLREGAVLNYTPTTTTAGVPPAVGPGISSTTDYRNNLDSTENQLNEFANDPYMPLFQKMTQAGVGAEDMARREARASSAKFERGVIDQSQRREAGLETIGLQTGLSQYAPGLQQDVLDQNVNQTQARLKEIDDAEQLALARARQARQENDLSVMKEQIGYVQELRKAKADALAEASKAEAEQKRWQMKYDRDVLESDRSYELAVQKAARGGGGGGGGGGDEDEFFKDISRIQGELRKGLTWGEAFNSIKARYNDAPDALIDSLLGKETWSQYGAYTNFKNSLDSVDPEKQAIADLINEAAKK